MAWFNCTVNQVGVLNYGSTTNPNVLLNMTDTAGSFSGAWFSVTEGTQAAMLSLALVAVTNNKQLAVGADPPPADGSSYPAISNFYLLA